tara:strand:+ start:359 stop:763 length:405 start_codon:yes stop_codon:yes gene_type:complete
MFRLDISESEYIEVFNLVFNTKELNVNYNFGVDNNPLGLFINLACVKFTLLFQLKNEFLYSQPYHLNPYAPSNFYLKTNHKTIFKYTEVALELIELLIVNENTYDAVVKVNGVLRSITDIMSFQSEHNKNLIYR